MAIAKVNGIQIQYQVEGSGPPLLLISGLGRKFFVLGADRPDAARQVFLHHI